ncbi:hypothetical protein ACS0TY_028147 [Phlomoides rotata]
MELLRILFLGVIISSLSFFTNAKVATNSPPCNYPAIYNFGDSKEARRHSIHRHLPPARRTSADRPEEPPMVVSSLTLSDSIIATY